MTRETEPERRIIFKGRKVDLALQARRLHDGSVAEREVVVHRGAVAMLVWVDDDHICMVKNERYAVGKTLLEVPAGTIDEGEGPDVTAVRELKEETGYHGGKVERIAEWFVSPGILTERMYLYNCTGLIAGPPEHEPDERIEPVVVPFADAVRMVREGRIEDSKSMLAILLADFIREREQ